MISKKKASIISELIVLLIAVYFLYQALFVLKWQAQWYRSSSLFPIGVSLMVIIASLVALYQDTLGKHRNNTKKLNIGDLKRLPYILGIMVAELLVWQLLDLFYVSVFLGTAAMIMLMNVNQKNWKKRIGMAAIVSGVFVLAVYLLFDVVCQVTL